MRKIPFTILILVLTTSAFGQNESEWQLWSNIVVGSNITSQLYVHADIRHRQNIGNNFWNNTGILIRAEYSFNKLLNASFELLNNHTKQSSSISNYEFAQRLGIKVFILRNGVNIFKLKKGLEGFSPKTELTNLTRFDHRIFNYPDVDITDYFWRLRNRTQFKYALNRETLLENKLLTLFADLELFFPLSNEPKERYLSKMRFRIGPEYRYSVRWRFRILYAFDHAGNGFSNNDNIESQMLNLRIKYVF
ncbi:DUF2490 domain-containing protein [Carboxylicivirga sp. RSCT41]|uniref:DUF2490 domain-containing protein n=1 Tax=Carboxylicivirga agarovorans TaxID=3417570 RepID=UPI003D357CD8